MLNIRPDDVDAAHPGGAVMDAENGVQHIFIYCGKYATPAGIYRITRTLDTGKLSNAMRRLRGATTVSQYTFDDDTANDTVGSHHGTLGAAATIQNNAQRGNDWYHVLFQFSRANGGENQLFVNGVKEHTSTNSDAWSFGADQWRFGSTEPDFWHTWQGQLDDIAIGDDWYSDTQAKALYSLGRHDGAGLQYTPSEAHQLFDLFAAGEGSIVVGGLTWYSTDTRASGNAGEVVQTGSDYTLRLGNSGEGVTTIADPGFVLTITTSIGSRQ